MPPSPCYKALKEACQGKFLERQTQYVEDEIDKSSKNIWIFTTVWKIIN